MYARQSGRLAESTRIPDLGALAQVAGGIVPALGDALTVIATRTSLLLNADEISPDTRESLDAVYAAATRAVAVVRQMALVSGQHPFHPFLFDIHDLLTQKLPAVRLRAGTAVEVELRSGSGVPFVELDEELVEQLLVELAANARDAMPAGGRLEISLTSHTLGDQDAKAYSGGRPGTYVVLTVADTGVGIAPEVRPQLFAPFVTSRDRSRHLGLGLAAIHGIVRLHHGWITVESSPGKGARFSVFLPVARTAVEYKTVEALEAPKGEKILILEDDPLVREAVIANLRILGYRVVPSATVAEALEAWKWHRDQIGLFITDVVLPNGESGPEIANRLFAEKPTLAVILTSGHDQSILKRTAAVPAAFQFLQKPWRPQTIATLVRKLLTPNSQ